MFRLIKVINSHNQCEVKRLPFNNSFTVGKGCAILCANGTATQPTATQSPDYITLTSSEESDGKWLDAMMITEDMVFKVEYSGSEAPFMGMPVGLATVKYKMDAVSHNSSGKAVILNVDDDKRYVYVSFRK